MSQAFAHTVYVGMGEEVTWGTPVAASQYFEVETEDLKKDWPMVFSPPLNGVSQQYAIPDKIAVAGSISGRMQWDGWGLLLKHALGSATPAGTAAPYTHTIKGATDLPVGLTVLVNKDAAALTGSSCFQYAGCKINKLTLTQEPAAALMLTAEMIGKDLALIAKTGPTYPTYNPVKWDQFASLKLASGAITLKTRRFELTVENQLADDHYILEQQTRATLGRNGPRTIRFSADVDFEDSTTLALFLSHSATDVVAIWGPYGAGADQKKLTITMPKVVLDGSDPAVSGPGPIPLTIQGTAQQNAAEHDECVISLQNATASI